VIFRYSQRLQTGDYGCPVDFPLAKQKLEEATNKGYYKAQLRLVKVHFRGLFRYDKNPKIAAAIAI